MDSPGSGDRDAGHAEEAQPPPISEGPALPYARAFVVQFTAQTDARMEHVSGRIEHLQTGRQSRFTSMDDLVRRIVALLGDSLDVAAEPRESSARRAGESRGRRGDRDPGAEPQAP